MRGRREFFTPILPLLWFFNLNNESYAMESRNLKFLPRNETIKLASRFSGGGKFSLWFEITTSTSKFLSHVFSRKIESFLFPRRQSRDNNFPLFFFILYDPILFGRFCAFLMLRRKKILSALKSIMNLMNSRHNKQKMLIFLSFCGEQVGITKTRFWFSTPQKQRFKQFKLHHSVKLSANNNKIWTKPKNSHFFLPLKFGFSPYKFPFPPRVPQEF